MDNDPSFAEFVRRIRAGDDTAAEELVRRYEPLIRREVRLRIEDDRLNRAFDSIDVSQSVLASFFVRAAVGQYDLDRPDQLTRLLVAMARNKLASRAGRSAAYGETCGGFPLSHPTSWNRWPIASLLPAKCSPAASCSSDCGLH